RELKAKLAACEHDISDLQERNAHHLSHQATLQQQLSALRVDKRALQSQLAELDAQRAALLREFEASKQAHAADDSRRELQHARVAIRSIESLLCDLPATITDVQPSSSTSSTVVNRVAALVHW